MLGARAPPPASPNGLCGKIWVAPDRLARTPALPASAGLVHIALTILSWYSLRQFGQSIKHRGAAKCDRPGTTGCFVCLPSVSCFACLLRSSFILPGHSRIRRLQQKPRRPRQAKLRVRAKERVLSRRDAMLRFQRSFLRLTRGISRTPFANW